jgi:hypothetical protein
MNVRCAAWVLALTLGMAGGIALGTITDPPERVARMSYILGRASVQGTDSDAADSAAVNWPVSSGDRVRTDEESGVEIDLGIAKLRLDQNTDLTLLQLDSSTASLRVSSGTVNVELREALSDPLRMQLGRGAVALLQPGEYRVDVVDDAATVVVRSGAAQISAGPARFQQGDNEAARIEADGTVAVIAAPEIDEFDRWSEHRARTAGGERSALHVPRGLIGYEELDEYGNWHWEREYGMVWEPRRVSRDWAPYRFGQWIWKPPWGWTWVDDAPWGFAPFHTGRWLQIETRWMWLPGPRQIPAVYAPALVSWADRGATTRDRLRWSPLGPGERYVPPYPASDTHIQRLNVFATVSAVESRRVGAR